jgi:hypothetical protein
MKGLLMVLVPALLVGCLSASVEVTYNEQMQPISCHASYLSLGRDVEAAAFKVCGNDATVEKSAGSDFVRQVLEAALRAAALP